MHLKLLIVALALILTAITLPCYGEDLLDVYRQARVNDPVLAQANAQRLVTHEGVNQARSALLPHLAASLKLSQQHGADNSSISQFRDSGMGHARIRNVSFTLTQSVMNFSQIDNLHAAHASAHAEDERYAAAEQNLYVRVATAYFNVLTAQDKLSYARANENAYKQQYEQASQRFKVKLSAITDVYQARSYYESAKAKTLAAQNLLNDAREALIQITGNPLGTLKRLHGNLLLNAPTPANPKVWVEKALKNNPQLIAQSNAVNAAQERIKAARAEHLPELNASVSRGKNTTWLQRASAGGIPGNGRYQTVIGLSLSVPIFSGGNALSLVRQSIYQRDAARDVLENTRRKVKRDALNYYRLVIAGISQVQSGKAAVEYAQKTLDATRAGFKVGTKTMTDVLLAIQALTQSESIYSQNRQQFILDKLRLAQTVGTASMKNLRNINMLLQ